MEGRDTLVFSNGNRPRDPWNFVRHEFRPALERAGLRRIRFHDLRHTYATIMLSLGADIKSLQVWIGHASIRTTLDHYGHLLHTNDEAVQDGMTEIMRKRLTGEQPEGPDEK